MNILGGGTGRGRGEERARAPAEEWIQEDKSGFNVASESLPGKREKVQNGARPAPPAQPAHLVLGLHCSETEDAHVR